MKFFDLQLAFFKPLWLRVVVVVFCFGWATFEFANASAFWGIIFGACGLYAAWEFFYVFNPKPEENKPDTYKSDTDEDNDG